MPFFDFSDVFAGMCLMVLSLALLCLTGSVRIWAISKPEQCLALSQDEGALWLGALKQARTASRTQSG